ncbi:short-chain fatty acyl-CoA regulator family protein [Lichenibacterium minor]|uniref:short-chain fatty acyl-CoA regulator family protein n=1 Tax=Lichenibacterium minor TaxID=2316528 RepID=UPI001A9187B2
MLAADPPVTAVDPACRICEQPECPARAARPVTRTLMVDDFRKTVSPPRSRQCFLNRFGFVNPHTN